MTTQINKDLQIKAWQCDACAEAENSSGLPCTLMSEFLPEAYLCPVSGDECEWYEIIPQALAKYLSKLQGEIEACTKPCHTCKCNQDCAFPEHEDGRGCSGKVEREDEH